jgi:hypothetical protein
VQFRHSCSLVLEMYICSTKSIDLQITKCYGTIKGPVSLIHGQFPRNECVKFLLVSSLVRNRDRLAINKYLRTGDFVLSTDKNAVTDNVTMRKIDPDQRDTVPESIVNTILLENILNKFSTRHREKVPWTISKCKDETSLALQCQGQIGLFNTESKYRSREQVMLEESRNKVKVSFISSRTN